MPGYRYTPTEATKKSNVCPHCRLLLRDAVQTEEGYRLCHDCCLAIQELRYVATTQSGSFIIAGL